LFYHYFSSFPNLQCLYVPFNHLKILHNLDGNPRLKLIDARSNELTEVALAHQPFLQELLLGDNQLRDLDIFMSRIAHMRDLSVLDLRGNPLSQEKGYRRIVIAKFLYLRVLDGLDITEKERAPPQRLLTRAVFVRPRVKSMLDYLRSRPLSEADSSVEQKTLTIRRNQEQRRQRELEEATAVARARKEAFEAAAHQKTAPIPDWLRPPEGEKSGNRDGDDQKRGPTRMWLKTARYRELELTSPEQALLMQMNPGLTDKALKRAVDFAVVYPTFA
jgi:hypothetical protein